MEETRPANGENPPGDISGTDKKSIVSYPSFGKKHQLLFSVFQEENRCELY
jgi:hypothetical protein